MKPTVSVNSTALPPASSTRLRRVGAAKAQAFRQVQAWRVLAWQEAAPELATLLPAPRWRPTPRHISCSGVQRGETACLVLSHHPFRLRLATLPRHDYQWSPRGGVQRGKQLVLRQHPRVGQRVEQRGLACRVQPYIHVSTLASILAWRLARCDRQQEEHTRRQGCALAAMTCNPLQTRHAAR